MKIAFDAKRAYQNGTGLGNYSRTLISSLATFFPENRFYLCAPKITHRFEAGNFKNIQKITPTRFIAKTFSSLWRSIWVKNDLRRQGVDIYHGLSHEIPIGIQKTSIRSVVTIHDLIFERYPKQYNWIDVQIYRKKFKYACKHANAVVAISEQTKNDIVQFYKIPEDKISVCYQSCDPAFGAAVSADEKPRIKELYQLPDTFFLYVGSIIERKNLLTICKALKNLQGKLEIPLVVIGNGSVYKKKVKAYIYQNNIESSVIFLSDRDQVNKSAGFQSSVDLPAIYQLSTALIYPSFYEGFGLPVLEALWGRVPVITSNTSCLPETGGDAALYVNPNSPHEIATAMFKVATDKSLVSEMKEKGWQHAQKFTAKNCATQVMQVYLRLNG